MTRFQSLKENGAEYGASISNLGTSWGANCTVNVTQKKDFSSLHDFRLDNLHSLFSSGNSS